MNNSINTPSTASTESIATITNALLEDLFNPSIAAIDLCSLHGLTLSQLAAILESETFAAARQAFDRINAARQSILTQESRTLALARLADQLKDHPESTAHAETQRKAATKILSTTEPAAQPNTKPAPPSCSPAPSITQPTSIKNPQPPLDNPSTRPTLCRHGAKRHTNSRQRRQADAMPLPVLLQLVSTCAIVVGSLCAILAYLRGSKSHQQSLNAQVFLNLTERHAALIDFRRLEADGRLNDHWLGDPETAAAIRDYFDLLSHEFSLVELGILDRRVWQIWQPDIKRIVNTQLACEIWHHRTRHLHRASPVFIAYIDSIVAHQRGVFADGHTGGAVRTLQPTGPQPIGPPPSPPPQSPPKPTLRTI